MDARPDDRTIAELVISAVVPTFPVDETPDIAGLPLLDLGALVRDGSMVYGIATLDGGGRVSERLITRLLGWQSGQSLDLTRVSDAIVVRRHPLGPFRVPGNTLVTIPAAIRHWCGLSPGDRVLLAAAPEQGVLLIHTMAALDRMVVRHNTELAQNARP
jgi:bifunctional DNA-binding transcriptional regulator/antitoxin component of YhaV-PrlF toxin-antitoxin module